MSFRDLLMDAAGTTEPDVKQTEAEIKLLSSYFEQHPLPPLDVAALLMIGAGLAMRQRDPMKVILIASLVKACYARHPHSREIDEALEKLLTT